MPDLRTHLERLKRSENTIRTYETVVGLIPSDADPIEWLHTKLRNAPIGTVLPFRAAVKHHCITLGMPEEEIAVLLPPARGGMGKPRTALGPVGLADYYDAVARLKSASMRSILEILPRTGFRISEAVSLRWDQRKIVEDIDGFEIVGKRLKVRFVPLTPGVRAIVDTWAAAKGKRDGSDVYVFPGYGGHPFSTSAVRRALIDMRRAYAERTGKAHLDGCSPHVLRHTFCTNAIKVLDIRALQEVAGHESMNTTARYLHPSVAETAAALASLDEGAVRA